MPGPDPEGRSYIWFARFRDPDGNSWLLQQITTRLPGRGLSSDIAALTRLLPETEARHGRPADGSKHHWSTDAAYVVARQRGRAPDEAATEARAQHPNGRRDRELVLSEGFSPSDSLHTTPLHASDCR